MPDECGGYHRECQCVAPIHPGVVTRAWRAEGDWMASVTSERLGLGLVRGVHLRRFGDWFDIVGHKRLAILCFPVKRHGHP